MCRAPNSSARTLHAVHAGVLRGASAVPDMAGVPVRAGFRRLARAPDGGVGSPGSQCILVFAASENVVQLRGGRSQNKLSACKRASQVACDTLAAQAGRPSCCHGARLMEGGQSEGCHQHRVHVVLRVQAPHPRARGCRRRSGTHPHAQTRRPERGRVKAWRLWVATGPCVQGR
eukprot:COSAG01_NODE_15918_length_1286_cov_0.886268_2_plen_174_part_00